MSFMKIIVTLVLAGAGLWAINIYVPMTNGVKAITIGVLVAALCLWLLQTFGVIDSIRHIWAR